VAGLFFLPPKHSPQDPILLQQVATSIFPDGMFLEQAAKRVKTGLIFAEIIKKQAVKIDKTRVRSKIEEIASVYSSPEEVVNYYQGNKQLLSGVENMVLEDQVIDLILDCASVEDRVASYQEIIKKEAE
jgi:trigger factor